MICHHRWYAVHHAACLIDVAFCTLDEWVTASVELRRDLVDVHAPIGVLTLPQGAHNRGEAQQRSSAAQLRIGRWCEGLPSGAEIDRGRAMQAVD